MRRHATARIHRQEEAIRLLTMGLATLILASTASYTGGPDGTPEDHARALAFLPVLGGDQERAHGPAAQVDRQDPRGVAGAPLASVSARRRLAARRLTPQPPLLSGERVWHSTYANPVNRNLIRIARCETGYLPGRRINWRHHNSVYAGGLGFAHSTWQAFRRYVKPLPPLAASNARPAEQLAVGRVLVRRYRYTPWPACHRRLGIY